MAGNDLGARIYHLVRNVDPTTYQSMKRAQLDKNSAGRCIEECVELAFAFGLNAEGVMAHVMDAIHNECKKAVSFPSEFEPIGNKEDRVEEIADMHLQLAYLRVRSGATEKEVTDATEAKMVKLQKAFESKELVMKGGTFYRRKARS
jgi:hypothetical protein